jgi:nicotinamidase-related amidase
MKIGLILVDIQKDYFPGGRMELVGMKEASEKAREMLLLFRGKKCPIVHIQHIADRDGATFFLPNSAGMEIHENVKPLLGETIIQKHHPNSFLNTRLHEELLKAGIESVAICGAMSHMCVDATTRAAFDLGYNCVVIEDACATRNLQHKDKVVEAENVHAAFMAALAALYAKVVSVNDFKLTMA